MDGTACDVKYEKGWEVFIPVLFYDGQWVRETYQEEGLIFVT